MCREKGAVKHDDRVDSLAQGVQWFTDALAQSAHKRQAERRNEEWTAMMEMFEEAPSEAIDGLCLGVSFTQFKHKSQNLRKPLRWN